MLCYAKRTGLAAYFNYPNFLADLRPDFHLLPSRLAFTTSKLPHGLINSIKLLFIFLTVLDWVLLLLARASVSTLRMRTGEAVVHSRDDTPRMRALSSRPLAGAGVPCFVYKFKERCRFSFLTLVKQDGVFRLKPKVSTRFS